MSKKAFDKIAAGLTEALEIARGNAKPPISASTKYRPHRRLLDESMAEMVEVNGRAGLVTHLRKEFEPWPSLDNFDDKALHVDHYCTGDPRIGWKDVWIITLDGYGVVGFCDGPVL